MRWTEYKRCHQGKKPTPITWTEFKVFLRKNLRESKSFVDSIWRKLKRDSQYQLEEVYDWASYLEHLRSILMEFDPAAAPTESIMVRYFEKRPKTIYQSLDGLGCYSLGQLWGASSENGKSRGQGGPMTKFLRARGWSPGPPRKLTHSHYRAQSPDTRDDNLQGRIRDQCSRVYSRSGFQAFRRAGKTLIVSRTSIHPRDHPFWGSKSSLQWSSCRAFWHWQDKRVGWPSLRREVKNYVRGYDVCLTSKAVHHKPYEDLQFLPIPTHRWKDLSMDFVIG